MNYRIVMGYVNTYANGDTYCDLIAPLIFDERHIKTRDAVIRYVKHQVQLEVEKSASGRDCVVDGPLNWRQNTYRSIERNVPFNDRNEYTLLECGYEEFYGGDLSFQFGLVELRPEFFKSKESEFEPFDEHRRVTRLARQAAAGADENTFGLKIKDLFWANQMTTLPDWDTDERSEYMDTIKSISKNLYEFIRHERIDLDRCAIEFQEAMWGEGEVNHRIQDHINMADAVGCLLYHGRLNNEYTVDIEARNDNGFFMSCRFILIPVVAYYNVGDTECGEN